MLHKTIKDGIIEALRAKDTLRLETLRGLSALFLNEMLATKFNGDYLPDDKVLALIKRSVKQRKDSIKQFEIGGRPDLMAKEQAELKILESFLPEAMPMHQVLLVVRTRVDALKASGLLDLSTNRATQIGKITGMIIKELAGKADSADVKSAVEEVLSEK